MTLTNAPLVIMSVNQLLSVSTNTWVLTNKNTAVTVKKVPCQKSSTIVRNLQELPVLSSHARISMNAKLALTDVTSKLTASIQHMITQTVANWIPMLIVHQVMTANVTLDTNQIQKVLMPTHVTKDPSVLTSTNVLLEHTTATNMQNATITRAHLHAHVKRDGLALLMVQEAAQTMMNVPTVFKPSHPLPAAEERKTKDSKTVPIHLVFVQTGQVVPISAC